MTDDSQLFIVRVTHLDSANGSVTSEFAVGYCLNKPFCRFKLLLVENAFATGNLSHVLGVTQQAADVGCWPWWLRHIERVDGYKHGCYTYVKGS